MTSMRFVNRSKMALIVSWAVGAALALMTGASHSRAAEMSYQGELLHDGQRVGIGTPAVIPFKFVLCKNSVTVWSNDPPPFAPNCAEPSTSVNVMVSEGIFSVILGGPGMPPISGPGAADLGGAVLRVWANTGGTFENLPDQPLASAPTAMGVVQVDPAATNKLAYYDGQKLRDSNFAVDAGGGLRFPDGSLQPTAATGWTHTSGTLNTVTKTVVIGNQVPGFAAKLLVNDPGGLAVSQNFGAGQTSVFALGNYNGTGRAAIGSTSAGVGRGPLTFVTADGERMTIDVNGHVGIGTTNPIANLQVAEGTDTQLHFRLMSGVTGFAARNDANDSDVPLEMQASAFRLIGGNVGIGTTTPSAKLDVFDSTSIFPATFGSAGHTRVRVTSPSASFNPKIEWSRGSTDLWEQGIDNGFGSGAFYLFGNNNYRMQIAANGDTSLAPAGGNVGIGTGAPTHKLTVAGVIRSTSGGIMFPDGTVQGTAQLIGPAPAHEWSGTSLRFQNPNGTFGSYVNLQGPQGQQGIPGRDGINVITAVCSNADVNGSGSCSCSGTTISTAIAQPTGSCTVTGSNGSCTAVGYSDSFGRRHFGSCCVCAP